MPKSFEKILIMKPSSLGDIVLALPALGALRKSFPEAKISWLIRPEFAPLLENHPYINEIIHFDRKKLGKAWYKLEALKSLIELISKLRKDKYDIVFDFQGLLRTAILAKLSGCQNRYGPADGRELAHLFYTHKIKQDPDSIHLVDFYLKIIKAAGAEYNDIKFELPVSLKDTDSVNKLLTSCGTKSGQYIVFIPGSAQLDKCWPTKRFAKIADKISSKFDLPILAVGTNSEKGIAEEIKALAHVSITNLAGKTSLKELVELLRAAKLVVSNDTGPGHIAAALGTPLVMMYSWSNPARIAPYGRKECMVAHEPYNRGLKIRSTNPIHSITNITVDEVFQKVCEQLGRTK
jgi:heptosyltransferase I